ncbi:hypothetical protein EDB87DRAFT_1549084, partial [Lactarius vividus]
RLGHEKSNLPGQPCTGHINIERVFSKGRLVLSHIRNGPSVQSGCASMCLG